MKETQSITPDQTELHAVKPVRKEKTLVARLRLHPGQKVFQFDPKTNLITEAQYEEGVVDFGKAAKGQISQINHSLIINEGCLYVTAISAKRADYKFMKMLGHRPTKLTRKNGVVTYVPEAVIVRAIHELVKQHENG
jgi:hypothetical protein